MYAWLWQALPGPWPVKLALVLGLAAVVVVICFSWVFPAVAPHLPFNENTVNEGAGGLDLP